MKRYDQYCPIACSLGLVGERWTLLVVRELMIGPQRYTDLAQSLDGIGTSLLASRLKRLETSGIIAKDWLVYERDGEEPLCALANTVAGALAHLARAAAANPDSGS